MQGKFTSLLNKQLIKASANYSTHFANDPFLLKIHSYNANAQQIALYDNRNASR